jgi:hypothetical protein
MQSPLSLEQHQQIADGSFAIVPLIEKCLKR